MVHVHMGEERGRKRPFNAKKKRGILLCVRKKRGEIVLVLGLGKPNAGREKGKRRHLLALHREDRRREGSYFGLRNRKSWPPALEQLKKRKRGGNSPLKKKGRGKKRRKLKTLSRGGEELQRCRDQNQQDPKVKEEHCSKRAKLGPKETPSLPQRRVVQFGTRVKKKRNNHYDLRSQKKKSLALIAPEEKESAWEGRGRILRKPLKGVGKKRLHRIGGNGLHVKTRSETGHR